MGSDSLRYRWLDAIVGKQGQPVPRGTIAHHAAVTLSAFMSDDGTCYPGIETLTAVMQWHRATVIRALNELDRQGWITRERGTFGKPTVYHAVIPKPQSRTGATRSKGRRGCVSESQRVSPRVAEDAPQSRTGATRTLQERSMERSKENALTNETKKEGDSALQYSFPTEVSEAFIHTRRRRAQAEDFPTLKSIALELKETHPAETIIEAVRTLGRSDDPPEALPAYVEAVAA